MKGLNVIVKLRPWEVLCKLDSINGIKVINGWYEINRCSNYGKVIKELMNSGMTCEKAINNLYLTVKEYVENQDEENNKKIFNDMEEIGSRLIVKYSDGSIRDFDAIELAMECLMIKANEFINKYGFYYLPSPRIEELARENLAPH